MKPVSRRDFLRWCGAGTTLAVAGFGFGELDANSIEVVKQELKLPKWDADGFRVALIADIHVTTPYAVERAKQAFQLAMDEKPDLIAIAGDFVHTSPDYVVKYIEQSLEPLHDAKCPVVAVMGNHDYATQQPTKVIATVKKGPLKLLRNEWVDVGGVGVMGLDDAIWGLQRSERLMEPGLPRSLISLLHEPDYADEMPKQASIQLSGHSHGGQMCLPLGIAVHTPYGARKYIAGFYPEARVPLYVTRGIGTIGLPMRLFCRPEVSILTLRSA